MIRKMLACVFSVCFAAGIFLASGLTTLAGKSEVGVATEDSIKGGLDAGTWVSTGRVKGENDKIVFDSSAAETAKLTAMSKINDYTEFGIENVFEAEYSFTISSVPEKAGKRFSFAYGLPKVSAALGSDGLTEVYFAQESGALKIGVSRFFLDNADKSVKEVKIVAPRAADGLAVGLEQILRVSLSGEGKLFVSIKADGADAFTDICGAETANNADHAKSGFTCIGQTGVCEAEVSSLTIKSFKYDNAETPLVLEENFDNGHYNANAFYSKAEAGALSGGTYVENGQLRFRNTSGYFITKHAYSNFELTFDITDIQRTAEKDGEGNVIAPAASWFGISLDNKTYDGGFDSVARSDFMYSLEPSGRCVLYKKLVPVKIFSSWDSSYTFNPWDEKNAGKVYSFKVVMNDGLFQIFAKEKSAEEFPGTPLGSYRYSYTPNGYVGLLSYAPAGYTVDNVRIVNRDAKPKAVEITYAANKMEGTEDTTYTDGWSDEDLLGNRLEAYVEKSGCGAVRLSWISAAAAVLAGACAVIITGRKK